MNGKIVTVMGVLMSTSAVVVVVVTKGGWGKKRTEEDGCDVRGKNNKEKNIQ